VLKGRTAIVTGSNRGIGAAVVRAFARNGADVFACARRQNAGFEENCRDIGEKFGVTVSPVYFDLSLESQMKDAVMEIRSRKKKIDILVNNAGAAKWGFFPMVSVSEVKDIFDVNFFSQVSFTQLISRLMAKEKSGAIVNVASVAGLDGRAGTIAYGASKSSMILATKVMSRELAPLGIRVNAVAPGMIDTDMVRGIDGKTREEMTRGNSLQRLGNPEEVAGAVLFLASDMSSYVTGQTIRVDGGM
jgi:3-oxoacyl-[acyl-carrier protein] reductase